MNISIGFSGPAGGGVNTVGLLLGSMLAEKGCTILADKEYASIIKGDNNCFFLYISDTETPHISKKIDLFFAFDDLAVSKNQLIYDLQNIVQVKTLAKKYKNIFSLGVAVRALGISQDECIELINKTFPTETLEANTEEFISGYKFFDTIVFEHPLPLPSCAVSIGTEKKLMFGNELLAKGAIESGLGFYAAYPMTPASSIIDVVVEHPKQVTFFQGEDEIAVGMAMLGAKYAGKRAMCGTSGGGFALMSESISFSHQAEIGGVYVLSMRDGPSTGTPTFTAQGDLLYAMNASFGDTQPIVFAPSTFEEMYSCIGKALNRSDIYQHPVIFLVDKQLSECYKTVDVTSFQAEPINRGIIAESSQDDTYLRYVLTESGISPYAVPGQENLTYMCSSYEHTESGETNENPIIKGQQTEKRMKKLESFVKQEFTDSFYGYEIVRPEAKNFFITRGMNRYTIDYAIHDKPDWGVIIIKSFQPFDMRLKEFFQSKKDSLQNIIFAEMNSIGQMQQIVMNKCNLVDDTWQAKIHHTRKYTLYPFFYEEIEAVLAI